MGRIARVLSFVKSKIREKNFINVKCNPDAGSNVTAQHFSDSGDDSHPLPDDYVYYNGVPAKGRAAAIGYIDHKNEPKANAGEKRSYARNTDGTPVNEVYLKNDGSVFVSNDNGSILLRPDGGSIVTTPNSTVEMDSNGNIIAKNTKGSLSLNVSGAIEGSNIGKFELKSSGVMNINGVTIDLAGNIVTPTTITAATSVTVGSSVISPAAMTATTVAGTSSLTVAGKEMGGHTHFGSPSAPDGPVSSTGAPT